MRIKPIIVTALLLLFMNVIPAHAGINSTMYTGDKQVIDTKNGAITVIAKGKLVIDASSDKLVTVRATDVGSGFIILQTPTEDTIYTVSIKDPVKELSKNIDVQVVEASKREQFLLVTNKNKRAVEINIDTSAGSYYIPCLGYKCTEVITTELGIEPTFVTANNTSYDDMSTKVSYDLSYIPEKRAYTLTSTYNKNMEVAKIFWIAYDGAGRVKKYGQIDSSIPKKLKRSSLITLPIGMVASNTKLKIYKGVCY